MVQDMINMVEEQVIKLKYFIRYCGLTFEDIIFELKRQIFENNIIEFSDDEDDEISSRIQSDR